MVLGLAVALLLLGWLATTYLLGFRLGGSSTLEELTRVRAEAAQARRQLDTLTRRAFAAMLDESRRYREP